MKNELWRLVCLIEKATARNYQVRNVFIEDRFDGWDLQKVYSPTVEYEDQYAVHVTESLFCWPLHAPDGFYVYSRDPERARMGWMIPQWLKLHNGKRFTVAPGRHVIGKR